MSTETKKREDHGVIAPMPRDIFALTWIGDQYAIRLDHLQVLLGQYKESDKPLSIGATRNLVGRWKEAGWVETRRLMGGDPKWVWLTKKGMGQVSLKYAYKSMETGIEYLNHRHAINEIRLHGGAGVVTWTSERQLLQDVAHHPGEDLLHRPDAEVKWTDEGLIAIEAERSQKKNALLAENLMELVRGEAYLRLKMEYGITKARKMSQGKQSRYAEIWYFGKKEVRKQVRRVRQRLVEQGALSEEEANKIYTKWYPLAVTAEQIALEDKEDAEEEEYEDD